MRTLECGWSCTTSRCNSVTRFATDDVAVANARVALLPSVAATSMSCGERSKSCCGICCREERAAEMGAGHDLDELVADPSGVRRVGPDRGLVAHEHPDARLDRADIHAGQEIAPDPASVL